MNMTPGFEELERIARLSEEFSRAVDGRRFFADAEAAASAFKTMKPGELDAWADLAQEIFDLRQVFSQSGQKPGEDFLKKLILHADHMADVVARVVPPQSVAELLPADLRSDANIDLLRQYGAVHLADLSALKKV